MIKRNPILIISLVLLIPCAGCVEIKKADETWESSGPIKIRLERKYYQGNDYYFFDAFQTDTGRWNRIMRVWRDATGGMPVENVHVLDAHVAYVFLVDQVAITKDGGKNWAVFNTSKYFACGWDGCANIHGVNFYVTGIGHLTGQRRVGTNWVDYQMATNDFGVTWTPA
jgi:hypothetical protein